MIYIWRHNRPECQVQLTEAYPNEWKAKGPVGVVVPSESVLANKQCDFAEGYEESTFGIPVTKWDQRQQLQRTVR